ncbi:MAG TPA: cytochrome c oxidase subunit II [Bryobacteraceae bacterium]|nr:cytochrome c oxidase subunit II [Bryobacteraceae bacterium]
MKTNTRQIFSTFAGVLGVACLSLLISCAGHQQSAVDPAGPQSGRIDTLWWSFFWLLGAIFVIVMVLTLMTLGRRHRGFEQEPLEATHKPSEETDSRLRRIIAGATVTTVVILFVLIVASVGTGKANSELQNKKNPLTIQVTGNQWWWQLEYMNSDPTKILVTANEMHIPVGRPVQIRGISNDVIHSFWVPNLNGKRDLIPSHVTTQWMEADHPGVFRGQCAEFCGLQHAHMAIWVIAEPEDKFDAWMRAQLQPAAGPSTPELQRGRQVFMNNACVYCHEIQGTTAAGQNGPDLTHFGSRRGIAANTVPNTAGNLAGWILDPQSLKPGNHMATIALNSTDLQPLVEYLESLK